MHLYSVSFRWCSDSPLAVLVASLPRLIRVVGGPYDRRAPECGEFTLTRRRRNHVYPLLRRSWTVSVSTKSVPACAGAAYRKGVPIAVGHLSYSVVRLAIYPLYRTRIPREHQRQRVTPIAVR